MGTPNRSASWPRKASRCWSLVAVARAVGDAGLGTRAAPGLPAGVAGRVMGQSLSGMAGAGDAGGSGTWWCGSE